MPSDELEICPECESNEIRNRVVRAHVPTDCDSEWRCANCGHRFDEPDTRPRKRDYTPGVGSSVAAAVARTEPDEIGGDVPEGDSTWRELNEKATEEAN